MMSRACIFRHCSTPSIIDSASLSSRFAIVGRTQQLDELVAVFGSRIQERADPFEPGGFGRRAIVHVA